MRRSMLFALLSVSLAVCNVRSAAENWPQWRGPLGTGVAAAGDYPVKFSGTEGVAWKVEAAGRGHFDAGRLGRSHFRDVRHQCDGRGRDGVVCYDMQGKELWRTAVRHRSGRASIATRSGSNPSPVTDGENLVVYFKTRHARVFRSCRQREVEDQSAGEVRRRTRCGGIWARRRCWRMGSVIVAVMQEGDSYLVGVRSEHRRSGLEAKRGSMRCRRKPIKAYSTPQVVQIDGQRRRRDLGRRSSYRPRRGDRQAAVGMRRISIRIMSGLLADDRFGRR